MRLVAAFAALFALSVCVSAADEQDASLPIFGQVSIGGAYSNWLDYSVEVISFDPEPQFLTTRYPGPWINLNSKLAFQSDTSALGGQIDFDVQGFSLDWLRPQVFAVGYEYSANSIAHATYLLNQDLKVGAYLGFRRRASNSDGQVFDTSFGANDLLYGTEVLYIWNNDTWFEAHAGIDDFLGSRFSFNGDAITYSDPENDIYAFDLGAAVHHRFSPQWSASLGVSLLSEKSFDFRRQNWQVEGGVQYDLKSVPLKLSTSLAYFRSDFEEGFFPALHDRFEAKARLTWSFGSTLEGAAGKLFSGARLLSSAN
jgi:hypothetical protein